MRIKRISTDTVRCLITEDELRENGLEVSDFLSNDGRTEEFLRMVMSRAEEEVGFKMHGGPMTVQVAVLPEHTMALTFSEKQPGNFMELLEGLKAAMSQLGEAVDEVGKKTPKPADVNYDTSIVYFDKLDDAISFCRGVGADIENEYGMRSHLYRLVEEDGFYIVIERAMMDDKHLCKVMTVSAEFMNGVTNTASHLAYLQEHGVCMIADNAISELAIVATEATEKKTLEKKPSKKGAKKITKKSTARTTKKATKK